MRYVYCCQAHPGTGLEYAAAKVFRPRKFRAMKNDWFYKQGRDMIIDFPQTVDTHRHPQAYQLLARDVERLCHYFSKHDMSVDPARLTMDLWEKFVRDDPGYA